MTMETSLHTLWFDTTVMMSILAVGNICFGHFEEHQHKLRRIAKAIASTALMALLVYTMGRGVAYSVLGVGMLAVVYVHAVWLPKHGVNGWTGEPRERYEQLREQFRGIKPRTGSQPSQQS